MRRYSIEARSARISGAPCGATFYLRSEHHRANLFAFLNISIRETRRGVMENGSGSDTPATKVLAISI